MSGANTAEPIVNQLGDRLARRPAVFFADGKINIFYEIIAR